MGSTQTKPIRPNEVLSLDQVWVGLEIVSPLELGPSSVVMAENIEVDKSPN